MRNTVTSCQRKICVFALGWGLLCQVTSSTAAGNPQNLGVEWAQTMLAKRTAISNAISFKESAWLTTGALRAKSFDEALFPEKGVDTQLMRGKRREWRNGKFANGLVNPLKAGDSTATYLHRTLISKQTGVLPISLGSDDGIQFWFNGEKLLSKNAARGVAPDQDIVNVTVRPGTNTILIKIFNQTGDCGFYYNTANSVSGVIASIAAKYPAQMQLFSKYASIDQWMQNSDNTALEQRVIKNLLQRLRNNNQENGEFEALIQAKAAPQNPAWLSLLENLAGQVDGFEKAKAELDQLNLEPLRMAVEDLLKSFPAQYTEGQKFLISINELREKLPSLKESLQNGDAEALKVVGQFKELQRKALLSNPLLDFASILLVKRGEGNLGLPQNWQGNSSMNPNMINEIAQLPIKEANPGVKTVLKPSKNVFVGDVDLHFNADKILFSSIGTHNRWQVFEAKVDGTGLRQVSPSDESDIDSYDAVYLPDGRIIFDSTSTFQGVPCVGGADYVANLHIMNADGTNIRRLCYDQDNDWCPVMMADGRVMYLRWEYTDSAHYFSRVLMAMNPDGTGQMEFYGSNSYWPNSLFFARPIPGSASKFVGIVTGHHGVPRMGELVLFDANKGRHESVGAIQRIPGYGKPVANTIKDQLVDSSWPKFLHPFPLNEKYFLVSSKPTPTSLWGIYLVDIYDNMLLIKEEPGYALFEPLPLRPTTPPPIIPDKIKPGDKNAVVFLQDVYQGPGLKGVPRGTVKNLRIYQYEYSYRNQGGHYFVGMEGGWDVRRMIGTVAVDADGSALFNVPANTPVTVQPMDKDGKALQMMRSWFVGMPGEHISCVGCHEPLNASPTHSPGSVVRMKPQDPAPWYGAKRGFSFVREVQPVLDKYCSGCHNGQAGRPNLADPTIIHTSGGIANLPRSYVELHPYVRRNGPEGDYRILTPLEFHADTSLLVQMLRKGHKNVKLDAEAWDRLITWIDINVPAHGTFHEVAKIPSNFEKRRYEAKIKYACVDEDIEAIPNPRVKPVEFVKPEPMTPPPAAVTLSTWPITAEKAKQLQQDMGMQEISFDIGNGVKMRFRCIPAGEFVMGDVQGDSYEYPTAKVKIEKPFWMASTEVSLEQYQQFDPNHRNGYYDMHYKDQVKPGYLMDFPQLPVIRVSWNQAMAFCQWLSAKIGKRVILPTEAQWEWSCRAGSSTPMFYGDLNSNFSTYANLSDASISKLAVSGVDPQPIANPDKFWDFVLKDGRFNDGILHLARVGNYQPNVWGLHDMIGNVAEWTRDDFQSYPYNVKNTDGNASSRKLVRGGSWAERPKESRASSRVDYPAWQKVYNVGFRAVIEEK